MAEKLSLNTVMNEPRTIELIIEGRRNKILPFLSTKSKQITLYIPNPSIHAAQKLRQQYYAFIYAFVNKNEKAIARISMDVVTNIFKQYRPFFTKWWVLHRVDNETFSQIIDFVFQPTRDKEEEYLKNAMTLQKVNQEAQN